MSERIRILTAPYNPGWYLLLGIPGRADQKRYYSRIGWEWVRGIGGPGCFRTESREVAERTAARLHREVES